MNRRSALHREPSTSRFILYTVSIIAVTRPICMENLLLEGAAGEMATWEVRAFVGRLIHAMLDCCNSRGRSGAGRSGAERSGAAGPLKRAKQRKLAWLDAPLLNYSRITLLCHVIHFRSVFRAISPTRSLIRQLPATSSSSSLASSSAIHLYCAYHMPSWVH